MPLARCRRPECLMAYNWFMVPWIQARRATTPAGRRLGTARRTATGWCSIALATRQHLRTRARRGQIESVIWAICSLCGVEAAPPATRTSLGGRRLARPTRRAAAAGRSALCPGQGLALFAGSTVRSPSAPSPPLPPALSSLDRRPLSEPCAFLFWPCSVAFCGRLDPCALI